MKKIEVNVENFMALFVDNITSHNEFYYIIPKNISEKLNNIYKNFFCEFEKEKNFFKKCSAFFSYFFSECHQWCDLNFKRRINCDVWRAFFCNTNNITYTNYIKEFIRNDILIKTSNHSDKLKLSNEYQLNSNLIDGNYTLYIFTNKDIDTYQILNHIDGLDNRYLNTLEILKIDLRSSVKKEFDFYVKNNETNRFFIRINKAFYFNNTKKRKIHYGNKVKRIYHPICFLTKESRSCLNINFHHLDIVNCQPLLLCYHLKNQNFGIDDEFIQDVEKGKFYENVQKKLENLKIIKSRDEVKKQIYSQILFDFKNNDKYFVNNVFKDMYPKTYESLNEIHLSAKQTSITLASILQNLESELFNNLKVDKSEYFFTLFDAIYYDNKSDEFDLRNQIDSYFKKLGLKVSISDK